MEMSQDLTGRLQELEQIKAAIRDGHLDLSAAESLLQLLSTLNERNLGFETDLVQVQLLTANLLVASAQAGLPGALTGLSAQYVHNMASQAHDNAQQLGHMLHHLESELKQQLHPHPHEH